MEYSVRVYLPDINRSLEVQTELRTQIVKALRSAGLDIPYFAVQVGHASGPRAQPERVSVRINVALNADPDVVLNALGAAARRCPEARQEPAPEVAFENVGESALEFSLSAAIAAGASGRRLETALRVAAVKALRAHGIDLAGPHRHEDFSELESLRKEPFGAERAGARARPGEERAPREAVKKD